MVGTYFKDLKSEYELKLYMQIGKKKLVCLRTFNKNKIRKHVIKEIKYALLDFAYKLKS